MRDARGGAHEGAASVGGPSYTVEREVTSDGLSLTTVRLAPGHAALAPFVAPHVARFSALRVVLFVVRAAMAVWAFSLGVIVTRVDTDVGRIDDAVRTFGIVGAGVALLWFVLGALWSWQRTRNIHRLDGRYPSTSRSIRVWVYAPVWVALMSLTLVPLEPHPDLDVRPPIIVLGFIVTMLAPYRIVQRVFRSLVRVQPDAAVFILFIVDTIAIGLVWWRLSTWPDDAAAIDAGTLDLLASASFASAIALLIGLLVATYLDLEADRSEDIRLLALRTRHDHRLARLQGLDPMDGATRWALWTARQAADRALAEGAAAPAAAQPPPAPATLEPVGHTVTPLRADESPAERATPLRVHDAIAPSPSAPPSDVAAAAPAEEVESPAPAPAEDGPRLPDRVAARASEPAPADRHDPSTPAEELDAVEALRRRLAGLGITDEAGRRRRDPGHADPPVVDPVVADAARAEAEVGTPPEDDTADHTSRDGVREERQPATTPVGPHTDDGAQPSSEPSDATATPAPEFAPAAGSGARSDAMARIDRALTAQQGAASEDDALSRALRRRFAEAQKQAERQSQRPGRRPVPNDWVGEPGEEVPLSGIAQRLAERVGADLERGAPSGDFAARVRELSMQYSAAAPAGARRGAAPSTVEPAGPAPSDPPDRMRPPQPPALTGAVSGHAADGGSGGAPTALRSDGSPPAVAEPPRLAVVELLRYVAMVLTAAGVIACGWVLVGLGRLDGPDAALDLDDLDLARSIVVHSLLASNMFVLAWMSASAWYATRVEPTLRWTPFVAIVGAMVPIAVASIVIEGGSADRWSVMAMGLSALAVLVGLRLMLPIVDLFGMPTITLNAWLLDVVTAVVFLVIGPLGSVLEPDVDRARLAFAAIVVGLAMLIGGVLATIVMTDLENALRSSAELVRVNQRRRARTGGTRGSSRVP